MQETVLALDDDLLGVAENLPLLAREMVLGFMQGIHRSPLRGSSQEFVAYRPYLPGDPLGAVDWKAWARSDHLFVREYEEETNYRGYLFLDASKSMDYGEGATNKFVYARLLSALLSLLMRRQNDAPGLIVIGRGDKTEPDDWLPPATRADHIDYLLNRLSVVDADGECDDLGDFADQLDECRGRAISVVISDGLFPIEQGYDLLRQLKLRNHETVFFHLISPMEMTPTFTEDMEMVDSETGRCLPVDGLALKDAYQIKLAEFLSDIEQMCLETETDYQRLVTDEPLDEGLRSYLELRATKFK